MMSPFGRSFFFLQTGAEQQQKLAWERGLCMFQHSDQLPFVDRSLFCVCLLLLFARLDLEFAHKHKVDCSFRSKKTNLDLKNDHQQNTIQREVDLAETQ